VSRSFAADATPRDGKSKIALEQPNYDFKEPSWQAKIPRYSENLGSKELTTVKASKGPEGVAAGVGSGAVLGGALGWLVGMGALAIPGIGPFIAAGPIVAALAGAGA